MRVLCIIPARYFSTRLPGKPLLELAGKTIIQHVCINMSKSEYFDKIVVATDDKRIADSVSSAGFEAVMTSENCKSGTDRLCEVINRHKYCSYDIVVNVQGDEPLLKSTDVDAAIKLLIDNDSDLSTLTVKCDSDDEVKNPNCVKIVLDKNKNALYFSRSQIPYVRDNVINFNDFYKHIGVYVYKRNILLEFSKLPESKLENMEKLEQLRLLENGYKISVAEIYSQVMGVDTPEDFEKLKKQFGDK